MYPTLKSMYTVISKPDTVPSKPCTLYPSSKLCTLYPWNHVLSWEFLQICGITPAKLNPGLFSINKMVIVFTLNTHEAWYSIVKRVGKMQNVESDEIYLIHCTIVSNGVLKMKIKWFYLPLMLCCTEKSRFHQHRLGYLTFLSNFWWKYMVPKILGTWFRAWGTWYKVSRVRVPCFESTGYGVHSFSLPLRVLSNVTSQSLSARPPNSTPEQNHSSQSLCQSLSGQFQWVNQCVVERVTQFTVSIVHCLLLSVTLIVSVTKFKLICS